MWNMAYLLLKEQQSQIWFELGKVFERKKGKKEPFHSRHLKNNSLKEGGKIVRQNVSVKDEKCISNTGDYERISYYLFGLGFLTKILAN